MGCKQVVTKSITEPAEVLSLDGTTQNYFCEESSGEVVLEGKGGTAPYQYKESTANDFNPDNLYPGLKAGTYNFLVQDGNGCRASKSFHVSYVPLKLVGKFYTANCQFEGDLNLIDTNGNEMFKTPLHKFLTKEEVKKITTNSKGEKEIYYKIDYDGCTFDGVFPVTGDLETNAYIPNIFNPNSNDENSIFNIFTKNTVTINEFAIHDRWGSSMAAGKNIQNNGGTLWDGKNRNQDAAPGVYQELPRFLA